VNRPRMTTAEVCELANRGERTVYNWIKAGLLHPVRVRGQKLFDPDEVEALLRIKRAPENEANSGS